MTCDECKSLREPKEVPYIAHEAAMARAERTQKRLWVVILVLIILLFGTNSAWLYYESQFESVVTEIDAEQDGDGTNIVSGGDLTYGAESTHENNP